MEHPVMFEDDDPVLQRLRAAALALPEAEGPRGWLGMDLDLAGTDWTEVAELLDASRRRHAPARLLR